MEVRLVWYLTGISFVISFQKKQYFPEKQIMQVSEKKYVSVFALYIGIRVIITHPIYLG